MTYKHLAVASSAEVSAQLTGYLVECEMNGEHPVQEAYEFNRVLTQRMGIGYSRFKSYEQKVAQERFDQQVRRELSRRVAAGTLVRRGSRPGVRYVTPQASAEEDRREQEAAEQVFRHQEERRLLEQRLGALGVTPACWEGIIVLANSEWEHVLDLAERGKQSMA